MKNWGAGQPKPWQLAKLYFVLLLTLLYVYQSLLLSHRAEPTCPNVVQSESAVE